MGTLNFPGLATGIDTKTIIEQLMTVYSRRLALYKLQKASLQEKLSAFDEVKAKANELQSAANALADYRKVQIFKTSSSDSTRLAISATEGASPGSHSVIINQLASAESWVLDDSQFRYPTDYVGEGRFIYSYNYTERVITTTATTTLEDLVGLINNDEKNPGVTASLLYQGGKYRLMLTGRQTGQDYRISINPTNTEVFRSDIAFTDDEDEASNQTRIIDLDQWTGTHSGQETISITGKDHYGNQILPARQLMISDDTTVGHLISEISSLFEGIATAKLEHGRIILTDHMHGTSGLSLELEYNANGSSAALSLPTMTEYTTGGSVAASISALTPEKFVKTKQAQNAQIRIDDYCPTPRAEVQTILLDQGATSGTFRLSFAGQTTEPISYNASLEDIQAALNSLSAIQEIGGVTVTGNGLASQTPSLIITFAETAGNVGMVSIDLSALTGPDSATVEQTIQGNDQWISRNSNVISDAISGITLTLQDVNDQDDQGNPIPINITISHDQQGLKSQVDRLVSAYNSLLTVLKSKTDYDETKKKMGLLSDDLAVRLIKDQIHIPFIGTVSGFSSTDPFAEASDIGLTFDGASQLQLNSDKFNEAVKDHFMDVLYLLGAVARGNTNSNTIEFYSASDRYTTPGEYEVQVTVDSSHVITSAQIRSLGESTWRDMTIDGNIISGNSSFAANGLTRLYPENGLFLQVDVSTPGTFSASVRVKKGMATKLSEILEDVVKVGGRLDLSKEGTQSQASRMDTVIANEEERLEKTRERLVQRFARLEKALTEWQRQMQAVNVVANSVFNS